MVWEQGITLLQPSTIVPASVSVQVIAPESLQGHPIIRGSCPWIVRLSAPDSGFTIHIALEPSETTGELVPELAAALVADLLRPGWKDIAKPLTTPVLDSGIISRGLILSRSHSSSQAEAAGQSTLRALIPAQLSCQFNWDQAVLMLDNYHASVARAVVEASHGS